MSLTLIELNTQHIPEQEMDLVEVLINDLGVWPRAFEGPAGLVVWVGHAESNLCPDHLRALLLRGQELFGEDAYLLMHAEGPDLSDMFDLPIFDWL